MTVGLFVLQETVMHMQLLDKEDLVNTTLPKVSVGRKNEMPRPIVFLGLFHWCIMKFIYIQLQAIYYIRDSF